jgi:hypothetical protein
MNPTALTSLTSFVTLMIAVSVAVERMVEVLKGFFPTTRLFQANADPVKEAHRCAWIHILAGACGYTVAWVGKVDIFSTIGILKAGQLMVFQCELYWEASWAITGILASGGSAFWNHALDLIKATKVQQEKQAGI